jgi:hypothetical protein
MANTKRRQQHRARPSKATPAQSEAMKLQDSSAGAPMIVEQPSASHSIPPASTGAVEYSAQSLGAEQAAMRNRTIGLLAGAGALLLVAVGLFMYFRPSTAAAPTAPVVAAQATAVPATQAPVATALQPTAAPAVQATAVPATQEPAATAIQPTAAAPAVQATAVPATQEPAATTAPVTQAGSTPAGAGIPCSAIAGLPVYTDAICVEQDTDQDNGLTKVENTYVTSAASNEVRRFYESVFPQNGWTLREFQYDITVGVRQLTIVVETEVGPSGPFTTIQLVEDGAATGVEHTCNAIADLPIYPDATCIDFDLDRDDGIIKTESTYRVAATPADIRNFYANLLDQKSWMPHEFSHDLAQGQRQIQISAESAQSPGGMLTRFKLAEK